MNNESSEIIQILSSAFNEFAENKELELAPEDMTKAMEEVDEWIYEGINNGVYRCGFAITQSAYDDAVKKLFASMDRLEDLLATRPYVAGDKFTLSDIRLWQTLIRFDEVYVVYFKCDKRKVSEYPNIMGYMRRLWKMDGFKETTNMAHIKGHYYTSHGKLNYYGVIPAGPDFIG